MKLNKMEGAKADLKNCSRGSPGPPKMSVRDLHAHKGTQGETQRYYCPISLVSVWGSLLVTTVM